MRPIDKRVFLQAAQELKLWILVRRTNSESLQYIGRGGYMPKPIDCKAKSADYNVGPAQVAGLVVDPTLQPLAFSPKKLLQANKEWRKYGRPMLASGYSVEKDNPVYLGLLRRNGMFLHGDYDLYDIIDPEAASRNLAAVESLLGHPHMRGAFFSKVQRFVNAKIGIPMIQHGGDMQFKDHSEQSIDVFGPSGEDVTILNEFSVRGWYADRFRGRLSVGGKESF